MGKLVPLPLGQLLSQDFATLLNISELSTSREYN